MPSEELQQPHDRFFKELFSRKETAAAFLSAYLPPALAASADWTALELKPGSYVDSKLRHQESDLLFRVPFRDQPVFLYCLFEHQRTVDLWLLLRLLSYMVQIWQDALKANPKVKKLPPIVPLVLYQGPSPWSVSPRWLDRLDMPKETAAELVRFQPAFEHLLIDLSQISTEELRGDLISRLGLGLMKAVAEDRLLAWLNQAGPLLAELLQRGDLPGIIQTVLSYVTAVESRADFEHVLEQVPAEVKDRFMSIAEQLMEKGRKEGHQEGRQEGTLIGQIQLLQEILRVPVTPATELTSKSSDQLQQLLQELRRRLPASPK